QIDGTAPTFSEKPTIKQDENGKTLIFHCAIVADPTPSITWYHNGVKVQDDVKFQIVNKVNNEFTVDCSLFLKNVTVEDAGKYKVTARNDLGESNATISLNFDSDEAPIPSGSVKPTFTERPSKIIFECRLVGEPKPDVVCFLMEESEKLYWICRLEISKIEARDAGTYKAVARNSQGEGSATINLTFEESVGSVPKVPDGIPPRFPKKPTIRQEGDNLVMECFLEANPLPEIIWYRGDKVNPDSFLRKFIKSLFSFLILQSITENSRLSYEYRNVKKNKYILSLTIKNPTLQDGGLYRCNAFNQFGDSNANIDLNFETGDANAPGVAKESMDVDGLAPTFVEKPKIVPNESGSLVTMMFK
ncbi:Uncharacterized protein FKW44_016350, partial [Caligus rogercresseyi]